MEKVLKTMLVVMLLLTVALLAVVVTSGGSDASIGYTIIWSYFLIAFAVASALFCSVFSMIKAPAGLRSALISVIAVVAIVGISYGIANGNPKQIWSLADGVNFGESETLITDVSILVTYVAMGGAVLVSLFSEFMGVVRSLKSNKPQATVEE